MTFFKWCDISKTFIILKGLVCHLCCSYKRIINEIRMRFPRMYNSKVFFYKREIWTNWIVILCFICSFICFLVYLENVTISMKPNNNIHIQNVNCDVLCKHKKNWIARTAIEMRLYNHRFRSCHVCWMELAHSFCCSEFLYSSWYKIPRY